MSNRTKIINSGFMKISGASSVFFCCVLSAFLCQHSNYLLLQVFLTAASSTHQVCHAKVVAYVETA